MTKENFYTNASYTKPENGIQAINDGKTVIIRYDIEEIKPLCDIDPEIILDDIKEFTCNIVRVKRPCTYGAIVSAIITDKYSDSEMHAIVNNYLGSPTKSDHTSAFEDMQNWREHAKSIARFVTGKND